MPKKSGSTNKTPTVAGIPRNQSRPLNFADTIHYANRPVDGMNIYSKSEKEPSVDDIIERFTKREITEAKAWELIQKIKGKYTGDDSPKRYSIVPGNPFPIEDSEGPYKFFEAASLLAIEKEKFDRENRPPPRMFSIAGDQVFEDEEGQYTWGQAMQYLTLNKSSENKKGDSTIELLSSLASYQSQLGMGNTRTERELEMEKQLEEMRQDTRKLERENNTAQIAQLDMKIMQMQQSQQGSKSVIDQIIAAVTLYGQMGDADPIKGIIGNLVSRVVGNGNSNKFLVGAKDVDGNAMSPIAMNPEQFIEHEKLLFEDRKNIRESGNREKMVGAIQKVADSLSGLSIKDALKKTSDEKKGQDQQTQKDHTHVPATSDIDLARCPLCESPLGITSDGKLKCTNGSGICGAVFDPEMDASVSSGENNFPVEGDSNGAS